MVSCRDSMEPPLNGCGPPLARAGRAGSGWSISEGEGTVGQGVPEGRTVGADFEDHVEVGAAAFGGDEGDGDGAVYDLGLSPAADEVLEVAAGAAVLFGPHDREGAMWVALVENDDVVVTGQAGAEAASGVGVAVGVEADPAVERGG